MRISTTDSGWAAFSRHLCDTITVNNTSLSNHTLLRIDSLGLCLPKELKSLMSLNKKHTKLRKKQSTMHKIVEHRHFESDLKVLPVIVD